MLIMDKNGNRIKEGSLIRFSISMLMPSGEKRHIYKDRIAQVAFIEETSSIPKLEVNIWMPEKGSFSLDSLGIPLEQKIDYMSPPASINEYHYDVEAMNDVFIPKDESIPASEKENLLNLTIKEYLGIKKAIPLFGNTPVPLDVALGDNALLALLLVNSYKNFFEMFQKKIDLTFIPNPVSLTDYSCVLEDDASFFVMSHLVTHSIDDIMQKNDNKLELMEAANLMGNYITTGLVKVQPFANNDMRKRHIKSDSQNKKTLAASKSIFS